MSIPENLAAVRARIADAARAAGRDPASVTLVAVSTRNRTRVVTVRVRVRPSATTTTAVWTRCSRPESEASVRRASAGSAGFPRMRPSSATTVSAASTTSPAPRGTAAAFARATRPA